MDEFDLAYRRRACYRKGIPKHLTRTNSNFHINHSDRLVTLSPRQSTDKNLERFSATVQRNCHISDARQGTDYGLCTYLMKMREYYRWEKGLGYEVHLPKDEVGDWLAQREALWESLQKEPLADLPLEGRKIDPFDGELVNTILVPKGLVYSAGFGAKNKPLFFLGQLERREEPGDMSVVVAGRELARDLTAPAAMTQGKRIFVRRESFRRLLWENLESWRWNRPDNALGRAFACYDFESDLNAALDAMADRELDTVLLHEQGEYQAGITLGERWNVMTMTLAFTPAELMVRAVRDHWADCLVTLPELIRRGKPSSVHFYFGSLRGMRKTIFPALFAAYEEWRHNDDWQALSSIVEMGRVHWSGLSQEILMLHHQHGKKSAAPIKILVEKHCI